MKPREKYVYIDKYADGLLDAPIETASQYLKSIKNAKTKIIDFFFSPRISTDGHFTARNKSVGILSPKLMISPQYSCRIRAQSGSIEKKKKKRKQSMS